MTEQTVNTKGIETAAGNLSNVNSNISNEFGSMKSSAKKLDTDWTGEAGEAARTFMYDIFKINEAREEVLESYITLLRQKVNPDYTETESTNKRQADYFK